MRFLSMGLVLAVAACGGKAFVEDVDGSAGDASSGDGSTHGDATMDGGGADGPQPDASPQDCAARQRELDQLREGAKKCCPFCNAIQCDHVAHDLCCPISYSLQSQQAVDQFEAKVKEFELLCGPIACPAVPCPVAPSMMCDPNTSLCH